MNKKAVLLILVVCSSLFVLSFQENDTIVVDREIDWGEGILHLKITSEVQSEKKPAPNSKYLVEREIKEKLPDIYLNSILDIHVDSAHTIHDLIIEKNQDIHSDGIYMVKNLYLSGKNEGAYQSPDCKKFFIHFSFPLFSEKGLLPLFLHHERPDSLSKEIGFIPTREYTGLVVYAQGTYLSYGTAMQVPIEPALFPAFYDEDMNIVLNKWMCDPEFLKNWGMAAYSETMDEYPFYKRIGPYPLRTMADKVFGRHHCDIILPDEAVKKLLHSEKNRNMLKQGRILIIINPENERTGQTDSIISSE